MVSASKILTVSYGTFSCTLEGFDDSFETMKAIAEYFRDLAADDRYFGAEPPTPDAEMLARIAEREISRRVQAHEEQGKIVLRAAERETEGQPPVKAEAQGAQAATEAKAATPQLAAFLAEQDETVDQAPEPDVAPAPAAAQPWEDQDDGEDDLSVSEEAALEETSDEAAPAEEDTAEAPVSTIEEEAGAEDEDILSSTELDESAETEAEEVAEDVATEPDETEAELDDAEPEAAAETPEQVLAEAETVAAKLRRIRSVVVQKDLDYEVGEYIEDEHAQNVLSDASAELDALLAAAREDETEMVETPEDAEAEDLVAEAEEIIEEEEDDAFDLSSFMSDEGDQDDDLAEALEDETAADDWDDLEEDEPDDVLARDTLAALDDAPLADELEEAESETLSEAQFEDEDHSSEQDEDAPETGGVPDLNEDTLAQLLADAMPDEASSRDKAPLVLGGDTRVEQDAKAEAPVAEDTHESLATAEPEPAPVRARVIKMKREEFEAAVKAGTLEEEHDETEATAAYDDELTPEEEAELQRELAEVEAEMGLGESYDDAEDEREVAEVEDEEDDRETAELYDEDDEYDDLDELEEIEEATAHDDEAERPAARSFAELPPQEELVEPEPEPEPQPRRGLARLIGGIKRPAADVERIFDEADSQMGDRENSMRRNAIQHLRAAVAATRAEKKAGGKIDKGVDDTLYRSDLAEVVRPRRPSASVAVENAEVTRSSRPSEPRPAPLKLVAEQRVDRAHEPVRPRRVATPATSRPGASKAGGDSGFSAFAAELGATGLPDLLEAAAAYMSDVEGQKDFSRPMLMSKLREATTSEFSREDGLRSFGQLLRDGKLRKLKGGRFAATEHTEFREEARNAG